MAAKGLAHKGGKTKGRQADDLEGRGQTVSAKHASKGGGSAAEVHAQGQGKSNGGPGGGKPLLENPLARIKKIAKHEADSRDQQNQLRRKGGQIGQQGKCRKRRNNSISHGGSLLLRPTGLQKPQKPAACH